jgi:hypothetical protein
VSEICDDLKLGLAAFLSSVCVPIVSISPFSVSLRLAFPSVSVFPLVAAPGVVALLMLFAPVLAIGSAYSVGALGEYCFAAVG